MKTIPILLIGLLPLLLPTKSSTHHNEESLIQICDCDPVRDSLALVTFKDSLSVRPRSEYPRYIDYRRELKDFDEMWSPDQPISKWEGITTNKAGCVIELILPNKSLQGTIPFKAILDLDCIEVIDLSSTNDNDNINIELRDKLSQDETFGCLVSQFIESENEFAFDYGKNNLTGHIPKEILKLRKLEVFNLTNNSLGGEFPTELLQLPNIKEIILKSTGTNGFVDFNINHQSTLQVLDLSSNLDLWGYFSSDIKNFPNLKILDLSNNDFNRQISKEIGTLKYLEKLDLSNNEFNKPLPDEIKNLKNLEYLDISYNDIEITSPSKIWELISLKYLDLSSMDYFVGPIPNAIKNLKNLKELHIVLHNDMGEIPREIGDLPQLKVLNLLGSDFSGQIPKEIGNLLNLEILNLASNNFDSTIPTEIGNLTNLKELYLDGIWGLIGGIPTEIGQLQNLEELDLNDCVNLGGIIPVELGNLTNLRILDLEDTNLEGSIPATLGNLSKLRTLRLGENNLTGQIPIEFEQLSKFIDVSLNSNNLSSTVPSNLVGRYDLCCNKLSGIVPASISGNISNNLFTELPESNYPDSLCYNNSIFISSNKLTFDDILPNLSRLGSSGNSLEQINFDHDTFYIFNACSKPVLNLKIDSAITNNKYLWYKNDIVLGSTDQNAIDLSLYYERLDEYEGIYKCEVTNPLLPSLTLFSNEIRVALSNEVINPQPISLKKEICYGQQIVLPELDNQIIDCSNTIYQGQIRNKNTGCITGYEVEVICSNCNNLSIPEAITPNGDNINDFFVIPQIYNNLEEYGQNHFRVHNQYGQLVYQQENYFNDWEGTDMNSRRLDVGTYFFTIQFLKNRTNLSGKITIIR